MSYSMLYTKLGQPAPTLAAILAMLVTFNFASAADDGKSKQKPAGDQADAKSTNMPDEHAPDESPQLGVIVGSCPGEGVCVMDTVWGSPADEAGIVHGDYILSLNGTDVSTPRELIDALKQTKGGDKTKVKLWRQGETVEREVTLASKADQPPASHKAWLGVMLSPAEDSEGVTIERVMRGSPAAKSDLRSGDVIVKRDDKPISDMRSFAECIEDMEPGSELQLTVKRDGKSKQMKVTVGDLDEAPMRFMRQSQEAMQSMNSRSQRGSDQDESSMMESTLDEMRQRIRKLEQEVREMKTKDSVSQRSHSLGPDDMTLVVQRNQRGGWGRDRWDRDRNWDNDHYDWRNRYGRDYRSPLYRSPRYGNSYYRYNGRPYYGNFGPNYGVGRDGIRIGNFGLWW